MIEFIIMILIGLTAYNIYISNQKMFYLYNQIMDFQKQINTLENLMYTQLNDMKLYVANFENHVIQHLGQNFNRNQP